MNLKNMKENLEYKVGNFVYYPDYRSNEKFRDITIGLIETLLKNSKLRIDKRYYKKHMKNLIDLIDSKLKEELL